MPEYETEWIPFGRLYDIRLESAGRDFDYNPSVTIRIRLRDQTQDYPPDIPPSQYSRIHYEETGTLEFYDASSLYFRDEWIHPNYRRSRRRNVEFEDTSI